MMKITGYFIIYYENAKHYNKNLEKQNDILNGQNDILNGQNDIICWKWIANENEYYCFDIKEISDEIRNSKYDLCLRISNILKNFKNFITTLLFL